MSQPRLGLALGSGSARGWVHIGIIRALLEHGLVPAVVSGSSVGALVAAAYASNKLDALESWVRTLTQGDVWRLVDTTFRGGVMNGTRLMTTIEEQMENPPIEDLEIAFAAVATDLYTGEEIWLQQGRVMEAVRASSGLPGLFTPYWYQDRWLIDGGVVNPVPVSPCRAMGADIVIAVDLSRPATRAAPRERQHASTRAADASHEDSKAAGNVEHGNAILSRWSGMLDGLVESFRTRRSEPGLIEVMSSAVGIMQDRITRNRLATDPPDLVLRPDLADFQLMDFHRAAEAIDRGLAYVADNSPQLQPIRLSMDQRAASGEPATHG